MVRYGKEISMSDIEKHVRYFTGQFLQEKDFTDEQAYHIDRQERHNRLLHTWGIARTQDLEVTAKPGDIMIEVSTGTAFDGEGKQIVRTASHEPKQLPVAEHKGKTVYVVISYAQERSDKSQDALEQETRWHEKPDLRLVEEEKLGDFPEGTYLRLAKVTVANDGKITNHDPSVRRYAGVNLEEAKLRSLTLSYAEENDTFFPVLSGTKRMQRDLKKGTLTLQGSLEVDQGYIVVHELIDDPTAKKILENANRPCLLIGCPTVSATETALKFYWTDGTRDEHNNVRIFTVLVPLKGIPLRI